MQLALDITPSVHRALNDRAERCGMSLESWVADLLEKESEMPVVPTTPVPAAESLAEWLDSTDRMTAADAKAIDEAIASMDAADLAAQTSDPIG